MKRISLETERLRLYLASQAEMEQFIEGQTDRELIKAYQEMLDGYLAHPGQGEWYAIWMVTRHDGVQVGNLSFKGLNEDGSVGEFIGFFEFRDTGAGMDTDKDGKGDSIKNGTSIDVWVETLSDAYAWRDKYGDYVYIKLIKGEE